MLLRHASIVPAGGRAPQVTVSIRADFLERPARQRKRISNGIVEEIAEKLSPPYGVLMGAFDVWAMFAPRPEIVAF